jgi:hypothetical protein
MSDPQINPETGESVIERSPRFIHWVAFLVFSVITLGSAVQVVRVFWAMLACLLLEVLIIVTHDFENP